MLPDAEYRRLVPNLRPPGEPRPRRRPRSRESLDALILGTLSMSIGVVLMIALVAGVVRRPFRGWSELVIRSKVSYYIPSKDCALMALVGVYLGLAGILLVRRRHGTLSPLSVAGTSIGSLHIYLFFLYVWLIGLL